MYLSKLLNVFFQIVKNICPNGPYCFSIFGGTGDCNEASIFVQIAKCIRPICKIYFSKLQNLFVQIVKYIFFQIVKNICPNGFYCFSIFGGWGDCNKASIFVRIAKYLCPNWKMYLSKLLNVFVQIVKNICPNGVYCFSIFGGRGDCNEASWGRKTQYKIGPSWKPQNQNHHFSNIMLYQKSRSFLALYLWHTAGADLVRFPNLPTWKWLSCKWLVRPHLYKSMFNSGDRHDRNQSRRVDRESQQLIAVSLTGPIPFLQKKLTHQQTNNRVSSRIKYDVLNRIWGIFYVYNTTESWSVQVNYLKAGHSVNIWFWQLLLLIPHPSEESIRNEFQLGKISQFWQAGGLATQMCRWNWWKLGTFGVNYYLWGMGGNF